MKMTIVLLVVLGIIAGICAVVLVGAIQSKGAFSRNSADVTVVEAARNLPKGTRLTAEDVKMGTVKRHELSSDRYMSNMALVVNRTLAEDVVEGGVLMANYFETGGSIPDRISKLEPGMRAVSVSLSSSQVTGGLLYPGCIVDVLASFQLNRFNDTRAETKGEAVATTLLERVEVLAIEGKLEDVKDEEKGSSRSIRSSSQVTVTLKLDTKQAEALQLAAANGDISVSIRSPLDTEPIDPNPTVLNRGKLTRRGMLIDPIVQGQRTEGAPSGGAMLEPEPSSTWEVEVIRGSKVEDQEIKVKAEEIPVGD